MRHHVKTMLIVLGLFGVFGQTVMAQSFGKNKVQYRGFEWNYIQSKHFDVYYYDDNIALAEFTAEVAESSYVSIQKIFRYQIEERIPILVYNGHNDFSQTNVTWGMIDESVGGFTEIFKDRVVIPFQGSYKEFRHVIHHELTHAVMFQMFYSGGVGARVTGMARFQIPLWLAEGLAEYASLGWDTDSDMYMRDASLNGYVPPINYMSGYMVYKGGQSLLQYIADRYGPLKIGEILGKVRLHRNVNRGIKQSIGYDIEDLSKRWHKYLRKTYWPDIQNRDEAEDFAKRLTDHRKSHNFLNAAPSISPQGDKLVYLTDKNDYMDVYLMNIMDGKDLDRLVKGQRSDLFEEMHWLRPGMGWSPDGKEVVLATRAGGKDALHIMDVEKRELKRSIKFDTDASYSPAWSPDGRQIAFMGVKRGQSDLYLYNLDTDSLDKITDDVFSDMDPCWSPDGKSLVFVSDRGDHLEPPEEGFSIYAHPYTQEDLYLFHVDSKTIERITDNKYSVQSPKFGPDGKQVVYISDESGINNIYVMDLNTKSSRPITNLITGASQLTLSKDGSRLVFASFFESGYDIYLLNNPLLPGEKEIVVEKTAFMEKSEKQEPAEERDKGQVLASDGNYRNYVFGHDFRKGELRAKKSKSSTFLDSSDYKDESGDYVTNKYKLHFTPDVVSGGAGYSQFWGLQGSTAIMFSDLLGNHQITLYTDLFYSFKNSNFEAAYFYLPKRVDWGFSVFHYSYLYYTYFVMDDYLYYGYLRNRYYGMRWMASRPLTRYKRIDFGLSGMAIDRDLVATNPYYYYYGIGKAEEEIGNISKNNLLLINLGYTTDTVLWGTTGPMSGGRSNISYTLSPQISKDNGIQFWTIQADFRKYLRIGREYSLGLRMTGGHSAGRNPQRFLLGGMSNWINYQYRDVSDQVLNDDMFFFSTFAGPLRGTPYYELVGSNFYLANVEFRFPAIQYLILGLLPLGFQDIRGVGFFDIGTAFSDYDTWNPTEKGSGFLPRLVDARAGYGFGLRANLGFFLLKYDLAWSTDLASTDPHPIHYFSLGADF